jgi:transposase-like protein
LYAKADIGKMAVMAQHFLLSAAARSLSIVQVMSLPDQEIEALFMRLRWPETGGGPVCPRCECARCYDCRRAGGQARWRCSACRHDFSITSGTLFAWHKLPLRLYLLATVLVCDEVKGKSMLALVRDLGVQHKSAFVLAHKLREAMASSLKGLQLGGEGRVAEVDGAFFGGHVRPENRVADRVDRRLAENRLAENRSGKRQVVVALRERGGRTLPGVAASEEAVVARVRQRLAPGAVLHADESPAWNPLHARFEMRRINQRQGYSLDGACTNGAAALFSRLRRGEIGHHHRIAGPYLLRYAQEAAWREDARRVSNGEQAHGVVKLAMRLAPSVDFCGYWQRSRAA